MKLRTVPTRPAVLALMLHAALANSACGDSDETRPADAGVDASGDVASDGSGGWTPPGCGDGVVDESETCDPPGACPTACVPTGACFAVRSVGRAEWCTAECVEIPIVSCEHGDGCCPAGCAPEDDDDCPGLCGNGTIDPGETCDPVAGCPTSCDDGLTCTVDTLRGAAASCTAQCDHELIVACSDDDGCCPPGCSPETDSDCSATCGNGTVEPGELCDGDCPAVCEGVDACTIGVLTGSATTCDATCEVAQLTTCRDGDGCCPVGCDVLSDSDCPDDCIAAGEDLSLGVRPTRAQGDAGPLWGALVALDALPMVDLSPEDDDPAAPPALLLVNPQSGDRVVLAERGTTAFDVPVAVGTYHLALGRTARDPAPIVLRADVDADDLGGELGPGDLLGPGVSGTFTVDGATPPVSAYESGRIWLVRRPGNQRFLAGSLSQGEYSLTIPGGVYDIEYERIASSGILPQNPRAVLRSQVAIAPSQRLDVDVPVARVSGALTYSGQPASSSVYDQGRLAFRRAGTADLVRTAPIDASGYAVALVPGVYDVLYESVSSQNVVPANPQVVLRTAVSIASHGQYSLDIPTVVANGSFTVRGAVPAGSVYDTGRVLLSPSAGGQPVLLGMTHEGSYERRIVAGRYDVIYESTMSQGVSPFNRRVVVQRDVVFDGTRRDINIPAATFVARPRLNGAPFPMSEHDMGEIWALDDEGNSTRIGRTSWGDLDATLVPGTYSFVYRAVQAGPTAPWNTYAVIREDVEVVDGGEISLNVTSHRVSGPITLNGEPFPASAYAYGNVELAGAAAGDRFTVARTNAGSYDVHVVAGTYRALYSWVTGDLPRNRGAQVGSAFAVNSATTHPIDVRSLQLGGGFFVGGVGFASVGEGNDAAFSAIRQGSGERIELGSGALGNFATEVVEGSYLLRYSHLSGDSVPRNQDASLGCVDAIVPR